MEQLLTRNDVLGKLRNYAVNPDDDVIIFKERIKDALLRCPELLYALNVKELESELFNEDGTLNAFYDEKGNLFIERVPLLALLKPIEDEYYN